MADTPAVPAKPKEEVWPHEGGSYVRNADGTLTRKVHPTKVPETAPVEKPAPAPLPRSLVDAGPENTKE